MLMSIAKTLKQWWALDEAAEMDSADNPLAPLRDDQKQNTLPLLTLAFGWGFLVTGLMIGGALGAGVPFNELVMVSFTGNFINFIIGGLAGYIGFKTCCNSGLLFRIVYGTKGALLPVLFLAVLLIGWQGIIVGAFGFAWAQSFDSVTFYAVAIFAGLLFTVTTYFGVKGLEYVSIPSVVILVLVALYAGWTNIDGAGGWEAFIAMSDQAATKQPMNSIDAINLVIGSWIAGAIVMSDYTRFAKRAWVALAIPFIVLIVAQWFLQVIGSMGGIVSGSFDFTTYLLKQGMIVGGIGLIGMSLALWTTGDTNLYLPAVQLASVLRRPQKAMTVVCGLLGTVLGLGLYQHFLGFINVLALMVPPLVGPVLVNFYIFHRANYSDEIVAGQTSWQPAAIAAYVVGAGSTFFAPSWMMASLLGLMVSMVAYFIFYLLLCKKEPVE
jgi:cytosine permease